MGFPVHGFKKNARLESELRRLRSAHLAALQLVVREHDVVRLDVPVADALLVDEEHRLYELLHLGTKGGLRPTHTRRFDAE